MCEDCRRLAVPVQVHPSEPTETLQRIRSGRVLGWTEPKSWKLSVFFAVNLVPTGSAVLRVGDAVEVRSWRSGPPVPRAAPVGGDRIEESPRRTGGSACVIL